MTRLSRARGSLNEPLMVACNTEMKRKFVIGLLLVCVLTLVHYFLWPSDEARIRKLFKEGFTAVESRNLDGVMSKVSFAYQDKHGTTYLHLKETLKREFDRLSDIQVEYEVLKIQVGKKGGSLGEQHPPNASDVATAELEIRAVATAGNETGYIVGDVKAPVHIRVTLEKERMKWLIVGAEGIQFLGK